MADSKDYQDYVIGQLAPLVPIRFRRMFGGLGLYAGDLFFALIDNDTLYLKVDKRNRPAFAAARMGPFTPFGDDTRPMGYYQLPPEALDDRDELHSWVVGAVAAAERAQAPKRTPGGRTRKPAPRSERRPCFVSKDSS